MITRLSWITYGTANGAVVSRLALHGEGDAIGGLGLDLKVGCSGKSAWSGHCLGLCGLTGAGVVEVLVEELWEARNQSLQCSSATSNKQSEISGRHTSLLALAMSEKAAGAAIVNTKGTRRRRLDDPEEREKGSSWRSWMLTAR